MRTLNRPLVRAALFTLGEKSYAWIVTESLDEWEHEPIGSAAARDSLEWAEAAFGACAKAYRRLQARHPELDIVIGVDKSPIGRSLRSPFR